MRKRVCCQPVSQPTSVTNTPICLISTITVGLPPPARVLAEDLTKVNQRNNSPNLMQMASKDMGKQATSELTDSHNTASGAHGAKSNQLLAPKPGIPTTHSGGPGPCDSADGGGQDPDEQRQQVSHLAMYISEDDKFADNPHHTILIDDIFALPFLLRQNLEGFDCGYYLLVQLVAFRGTYYHESGDVRPCYTGASPFNYPLDQQGHVALKLHYGVAAYSSYIGLVVTEITYSQESDSNDPNTKVVWLSYFNIAGSILLAAHHDIWGCLHYLPLISNVFLA